MRVALFAALGSSVLLAACGGPETSQANNAQANISTTASPPATANESAAANGLVMLAVPSVSGAKAAQVMHERHEGMETIGKNNKALKRELDDSAPDTTALRLSAGQIANLSKKASGWFPAGTGPDVGKTGAKPEIWQNSKDFSAKLAAFQKAAQALNAAASSGDVSATKARFADLGGTCKACHDKYRAEMKH
jgi:cytochrome c556